MVSRNQTLMTKGTVISKMAMASGVEICKVDDAITFAFSKLTTTFSTLKPLQIDAAREILKSKDVFVRLPTGFGKTVITAILPTAFDFLRFGRGIDANASCIICICPLTALMIDQKRRYLEMGISAEFLGRGQDDPAALQNVLTGKFQVVLMSPELIINKEEVRTVVQSKHFEDNLMAVVIDEAHCITDWYELQ